MTLIILITFIVLALGITFQPYIDSYIDYRGKHHIILWYSNIKGERKYLNIKGE
jgi:hypothetical protein